MISGCRLRFQEKRRPLPGNNSLTVVLTAAITTGQNDWAHQAC